jgi:transcriptional regulator with PAS, ATPase and Fis domain
METWIKEFSGAATICDRQGIIVYLNDKAARNFHKYGGFDLIGKNLMDCHSPASREKIKQMLMEPSVNVYTTHNENKRELIYQTPWMENGQFLGLIEIDLDLPLEISDYLR